MRVKAKRLGFYGNKRRRPGVEFDLADKTHFSKRWMEEVIPGEPVKAKEKPAPKSAEKDKVVI